MHNFYANAKEMFSIKRLKYRGRTEDLKDKTFGLHF